MGRIRRVVIHHSASPRTTTAEQIKEWHLARGWADIGYHFVIEGNGFLRHGRLLPQQGAHASSNNHDSIGVCIVGDNTKPEDTWTPAQLQAADKLFEALNVLWPGLRYHGHRDLVGTECPGVEVRDIFTLPDPGGMGG